MKSFYCLNSFNFLVHKLNFSFLKKLTWYINERKKPKSNDFFKFISHDLRNILMNQENLLLYYNISINHFNERIKMKLLVS